MRKMMLGVAKRGGTARRAAIPGYTVAGKTGTAQMPGPNNRGYSSTDFWGSFVGIIPATTPRLAILVTYQKGNRKIRMNQGGQNAAPVFKRIATMATRYLEIAPDLPDEIPEYPED
jgi:cell division protein FtsI (penicillin-binding protein 3)